MRLGCNEYTNEKEHKKNVSKECVERMYQGNVSRECMSVASSMVKEDKNQKRNLTDIFMPKEFGGKERMRKRKERELK